jgi:hypothetical protein
MKNGHGNTTKDKNIDYIQTKPENNISAAWAIQNQILKNQKPSNKSDFEAFMAREWVNENQK